MTSQVEICNAALTNLGASTITRLDDESIEARLCNLHYDYCLNAVIEAREWSFCIERTGALSPAQQAPKWGYHRQFLMPSDRVRVLEVRDRPDETIEPNHFDWIVEGDYIQTDAPVIYCRYLKRITDPNRYSPTFIQALAAKLSMTLAIPITQSAGMLDRMAQLYGVYLSEAASTDGMQGRSRRFRSSELNNVRGATRLGSTKGGTV